MAVDVINKRTPSRKAKGIPRVGTRVSQCVANEQVDAGRDGQTCLVRPNSQARMRTGKFPFSPFRSADHEYRIDNLTRLTHTLLLVMTIDLGSTYIREIYI